MFHTVSIDIFDIADKLKREADAEKRKAVQEFQQHQLEEEDAKHKQQAAEELAWAKHLDADVKKWQHAEAEKNAKREEATSRLKACSFCAFDSSYLWMTVLRILLYHLVIRNEESGPGQIQLQRCVCGIIACI